MIWSVLLHGWGFKVELITNGGGGFRLLFTPLLDLDAPLPGLLFHKDGIGEPVGVENLPDESCCQELGDLFAYGPTPLVVETTQALLGGL